MLYCWFSKAAADDRVGGKTIGLDGVARTEQGFGIIIDPETGKLTQYSYGTRDGQPWNSAPPDVGLVATVDDQKARLALTAFREVTPEGKKYCQEHGLPPTAESLISELKDFYQPKQPPGHVPETVDIRELAKRQPQPPKG